VPLGVIQQCCAQCSLSLKHTLSRLFCPGFGRHRGNYLITLYLIVKALYVVNAVGQLYMLNTLLGASYHSYGVDVISALMNGTDWAASPMFPRVTLCDFRVRSTPHVVTEGREKRQFWAVGKFSFAGIFSSTNA